MDLITSLDAVVFLGLAGHVGLRARRTGQAALRRLSWFLLTVGLVAGSATLFSIGSGWLGIVLLLGGLALYPVLLLRLGAALGVGRLLLDRLAVGVLALEAVLMAVGPLVVDVEVALMSDMLLSGGLAVVAHLVVLVVLRQHVVAMPSSFVRRRAIVLGAGVALLGVSLALGVFGSSLLDLSAVVALVGGAVAGLLLSAATAPPRWLQTAFVMSDYDVLLEAEEALATADDAVAAVEELLAGLLHMLGGRAAWFTLDGAVVASAGEPPSSFSEAVPGEGLPDSATPFTAADGEVLWLLTAAELGGRLDVVTGGDPVLYGLDVADMLPRTTRRIAVALEGRQLEQQRRAQARAEQEAEHYRRVAELKDDLLSTINHELRTPLGITTGALELVTARWDHLSEEQRCLLVERADANARMLSEVILGVLSLIELRSGTTVPAPAATTLDDLVERALTGLDVDGRLDRRVDGAAQVVIDTGLGARVLRQLTDNALQHTDGPVEVAVLVTDEDVELVVRDRGPGLGSDLLGPFERGGHYLHRTTRGLGLGLSLVIETAEVLGGDVRFHHDGDGTNVTCRLPHQGVVTEGGAVAGAPTRGEADTREA